MLHSCLGKINVKLYYIYSRQNKVKYDKNYKDKNECWKSLYNLCFLEQYLALYVY